MTNVILPSLAAQQQYRFDAEQPQATGFSISLQVAFNAPPTLTHSSTSLITAMQSYKGKSQQRPHAAHFAVVQGSSLWLTQTII